jgi:hypothetical protein
MLIQPPTSAFRVLPDGDSGRLGFVAHEDAGAVGWATGAAAGSEVAAGYSSSEDAEFFRVFWEVRPGGGAEENRIAHALVHISGGAKYAGNFVVVKVRREAIPDDEDQADGPDHDEGGITTGGVACSNAVGGGEKASGGAFAEQGAAGVVAPDDGGGSSGGGGGSSPGPAMPCTAGARFREVLVPFSKAELVDACVWRWFCGAPAPRGLGGLTSSRLHRENMRRRETAAFLARQGFSGGAFQNTTFHTGIE